ncbi:hypothetical protein ACJBCE_00535 [Streptomyces sp. NBUL23]|uniref:hypothetical protein n=1 Tax=Streptomyces sp. NBUL23 TaxID=3381354 RepID=UPI003870F40A
MPSTWSLDSVQRRPSCDSSREGALESAPPGTGPPGVMPQWGITPGGPVARTGSVPDGV